ncbi:MAG: CBO0543 family protein [Desulfotomaculaceae bacterium]
MADPNRMMELQQELLALRISDWYEKVISFQWFFLVFLLIAPWIIWWRFVNRKNIAEIFSFGLLISVISSFLNATGLQLLLWSYPYKLLPYSSRAFSISYSVLPVIFMLMYQYFRTWKSFATANVIMALIFAFILQPILKWMGMYTMINWSYFYSFAIYIMMGLGLRLLLQVILQRELMVIENVETTAGIQKQPGLANPALKRIINKIKP